MTNWTEGVRAHKEYEDKPKGKKKTPQAVRVTT